MVCACDRFDPSIVYSRCLVGEVISIITILQISYTVDPALSSRYHAHADGELLVLLDVTPSQEMLDEGVAREVTNKIQKLRKKVCINYLAAKPAPPPPPPPPVHAAFLSFPLLHESYSFDLRLYTAHIP